MIGFLSTPRQECNINLQASAQILRNGNRNYKGRRAKPEVVASPAGKHRTFFRVRQSCEIDIRERLAVVVLDDEAADYSCQCPAPPRSIKPGVRKRRATCSLPCYNASRPANRDVSASVSVSYAPAVFSREDEAKLAGLNSKALEAAMRRLFKENVIWNEPCGRPSRPRYRIVRK